MHIKSKVIAAAVGLVCATSAAQAEGYWGVAADVGKATASIGYSHDKVMTGVAVVLGNRIDGGNYFYGYEASASVTLNGSFEECGWRNPAPVLCKQSANLRLMGVVGQQMGDYDVYGKLGYGAVFGDFAVSPFSVASGHLKGLTIGVGASRQLNDSTKLFGEILYDAYHNSSGQPARDNSEYSNVNLRLGVMRSF